MEIVKFPEAHTRASTGRRACNVASASSVTPLIPRISAVTTKAYQYSEGIEPRWSHLRTAETDAPMSEANTSWVGQSPSSDFTVSDMIESLGPIVLNVKANMSHDCELPRDNTCPMAAKQTSLQHRQRFTERVRWARHSRGYTQEQMAELMEISQDKYKQYEGHANRAGRTYLPHDMIARFCLLTGIDPTWLFTEKGKAPAAVEPAPEPARAKRSGKTAPRRKAA